MTEFLQEQSRIIIALEEQLVRQLFERITVNDEH